MAKINLATNPSAAAAVAFKDKDPRIAAVFAAQAGYSDLPSLLADVDAPTAAPKGSSVLLPVQQLNEDLGTNVNVDAALPRTPLPSPITQVPITPVVVQPTTAPEAVPVDQRGSIVQDEVNPEVAPVAIPEEAPLSPYGGIIADQNDPLTTAEAATQTTMEEVNSLMVDIDPNEVQSSVDAAAQTQSFMDDFGGPEQDYTQEDLNEMAFVSYDPAQDAPVKPDTAAHHVGSKSVVSAEGRGDYPLTYQEVIDNGVIADTTKVTSANYVQEAQNFRPAIKRTSPVDDFVEWNGDQDGEVETLTYPETYYEKAEGEGKKGKGVKRTRTVDSGVPFLFNRNLVDAKGNPVSPQKQFENAVEDLRHQQSGARPVKHKSLDKPWDNAEDINVALEKARKRAGGRYDQEGRSVIGTSPRVAEALAEVPQVLFSLLNNYENRFRLKGLDKSLLELLQDRYGSHVTVQSVANALMFAMAGVSQRVESETSYLLAQEGEKNDGLLGIGQGRAPKQSDLDLQGMDDRTTAVALDAMMRAMLGSGPNQFEVENQTVVFMLQKALLDADLLTTMPSKDGRSIRVLSRPKVYAIFDDLQLISNLLFKRRFDSANVGSQVEAAGHLKALKAPAKMFDSEGKAIIPEVPSTGTSSTIERGQHDFEIAKPYIDFTHTMAQAPQFVDKDIGVLLVQAFEVVTAAQGVVAGQVEKAKTTPRDFPHAMKTAPDGTVTVDEAKVASAVIAELKAKAPKKNTLSLKAAMKMMNVKDSIFSSTQRTQDEVQEFVQFAHMRQEIDNVIEQLEDGQARFVLIRFDPTNDRAHLYGGFNYQGVIPLRNSLSPQPSAPMAKLSVKKSEAIGARYDSGGPLVSETELQAARDSVDFSKPGSFPNAPTASTRFVMAMTSLAYNLVPNSRFSSMGDAIRKLNKDLIEKSANQFMAVSMLLLPTKEVDKFTYKGSGDPSKTVVFNKNHPDVIDVLTKHYISTQGVSIEEAALLATNTKEADAAKIYGEHVWESFDKKTWGDNLRALRAAHAFANAMQPTQNPQQRATRVIGWQQQLITEMDMTSAGHMFAAAQAAQWDVLLRGGLVNVDPKTGEIVQDELPTFFFEEGTTRTLGVTDYIIKAWESGEGQLVQSTESEAKARILTVVSGIKEVRDGAIKGDLDGGLSTEEANLATVKKFDDMFAKLPIMATNYGETTHSKRGATQVLLSDLQAIVNAKGVWNEDTEFFLGKVNVTPLLNALASSYPIPGDAKGVDWNAALPEMDKMITAMVQGMITDWQADIIKNISKALGAVGLAPVLKDVFGHDANIGKMGWHLDPEKANTVVLTQDNGGAIEIPYIHPEKRFDPSAAGKAKTSTNYIIVENEKAAELHGVPVGTVVAEFDAKTNKLVWSPKEAPLLFKGQSYNKLLHEAQNPPFGDARKGKPIYALKSGAIYTPGPGTAVASGIGPALHQADESAFFAYLMSTLRSKTTGKDGRSWLIDRPEFAFAYVFDNVRSDYMTSFIIEVNAPRAAAEVMSLDKTAGFIRGNMNSVLAELDALGDRKVQVGFNTRFSTITENLDFMVQQIENDTSFIKTHENSNDPDIQSKVEEKRQGVKFRNQRVWTAYELGIWRPLNGLTVKFDGLHGPETHILVKRDFAAQNYVVKGTALRQFIKTHYLNKLTRNITDENGRKMPFWRKFEEVAERNRKNLPRIISTNFAGFMKGGLG